MFILSLTYLKSVQEADRFMAAHMDWVSEGYYRGVFIASGRKTPRTGGVILAQGERHQIEAYVADDPFVVEGIAVCEVIEVAITRTVAGLEGLKG